MEVSQWQWPVAIGTILAALGTLYGVYRQTSRRDQRQQYQMGRQSESDALEQCWETARERQKFYDRDQDERQKLHDAEKKVLTDRNVVLEGQIKDLREEIHGIRDKWSADVMRRVRLEEENKYLLRQLGIPGPLSHDLPLKPPPDGADL